MYWRDWRALEKAARRFRETKARARLAVRAEHIPLLSLDEIAFEDIMQELCQVCKNMFGTGIFNSSVKRNLTSCVRSRQL